MGLLIPPGQEVEEHIQCGAYWMHAVACDGSNIQTRQNDLISE